MSNEVKLNIEFNSDSCELGDVFLIDGIPHMLSSSDYNKLLLVSLKDGCRWDDPYSLIKINGCRYSVEEIIDRITENRFNEDDTEVEYVGAVKIEVSKL